MSDRRSFLGKIGAERGELCAMIPELREEGLLLIGGELLRAGG